PLQSESIPTVLLEIKPGSPPGPPDFGCSRRASGARELHRSRSYRGALNEVFDLAALHFSELPGVREPAHCQGRERREGARLGFVEGNPLACHEHEYQRIGPGEVRDVDFLNGQGADEAVRELDRVDPEGGEDGQVQVLGSRGSSPAPTQPAWLNPGSG
ncbi:MAG: hypothetical protein ACREK2_02755, partial [Gemmatimonadota bacterium]